MYADKKIVETLTIIVEKNNLDKTTDFVVKKMYARGIMSVLYLFVIKNLYCTCFWKVRVNILFEQVEQGVIIDRTNPKCQI